MLVVQKPVQDIYKCALFMSFVMLTIIGGIQAVSVLEQSGLVLAGASPVIIAVDDMDTLDEDMLASEGVSVKECEVVYHRASHGGAYLDGYPYLVEHKKNPPEVKTVYASADEDEDDMGDLYYALYTCSGTAVIAEGYI